MSSENGNNAFIKWNGVDISGHFTKATGFNPTNATTETTSGAGATDVQRNPGLNDTKASVVIDYDDDNAERESYLSLLKPGTKATLIYGPEGEVSGKPVHEQVFIISGCNGPNIDIAKAHVTLEISLDGADAPIRDLFTDKFA